MQADKLRTYCLDRVAHQDVTYQTRHRMRLFQVGGDVELSAEQDTQRVLHQLHLIEIYVVQVSCQGGYELLLVHEGIQTDATLQQIVVAV